MLKIKEIREAQGMTAATLARLIKTTPASVSRYENGKRKLSVVKAVQIAKALGVTLDELTRNAG